MDEPNPFLDDENPFDDGTTTPAPAAPTGAPPAPPAAAPAASFHSPEDAFAAPKPAPVPAAAPSMPEASKAHGFSAAVPAPPDENPFEVRDDVADVPPSARPGLHPEAKNWPRCRPCLRLAIEEDIPAAHRLTVRLAYAGYLAGLAAAIGNALALIVLLARRASDGASDPSDAGDAMGLLAGPGYLLLVAVLGWWALKYLYVGVQKDASRSFCCYFLCGGGMLCLLVLAVVGITGTYLVGAVTLVDVLADWHSEGDALVCVVVTSLWGLALLLSLMAFWRAHTAYRGKGEQGMREAAAEAKSAAAQSLITHAVQP